MAAKRRDIFVILERSGENDMPQETLEKCFPVFFVDAVNGLFDSYVQKEVGS